MVIKRDLLRAEREAITFLLLFWLDLFRVGLRMDNPRDAVVIRRSGVLGHHERETSARPGWRLKSEISDLMQTLAIPFGPEDADPVAHRLLFVLVNTEG
jgi:hypothetical protein